MKKLLIQSLVFITGMCILCGCVDANTSFTEDSSSGSELSQEEQSVDISVPDEILSEDVSDTLSQIYQTPEEYIRYGIADSVEKVSESVVSIIVTSSYSGGFYGDYTVKESGSGVIVSDTGYIATNCHVVEAAKSIKVQLLNGDEYDATLVGKDAKTDLAVIKIKSEKAFVPATFADSQTLRCGDFVFAIGNAMGEYPGSVTMGIISSLSRDTVLKGEEMKMLQTDAALNSGNSGGGLFDSHGYLVGIVAAKEKEDEAEGIGFAIPTEIARKVIDDIIVHGYVTGRPTLGFEAVDITSMRDAKYYGLEWIGVYISKVSSGSNAEMAGLKSKDYIYSVNGEVLTNTTRLEEILAESSVGDTLLLEVWRKSESIDVVLLIEEETDAE